MKAQYIKHKKQWSAFTTINGLDVQEYGDTEQQARERLSDRIINSKFLLAGIKNEEVPKVGDEVFVERRIGKNPPTLQKGIVGRFSKTIIIGGEETVWIDYADGGGYWHQISKVKLKNP